LLKKLESAGFPEKRLRLLTIGELAKIMQGTSLFGAVPELKEHEERGEAGGTPHVNDHKGRLLRSYQGINKIEPIQEIEHSFR